MKTRIFVWLLSAAVIFDAVAVFDFYAQPKISQRMALGQFDKEQPTDPQLLAAFEAQKDMVETSGICIFGGITLALFLPLVTRKCAGTAAVLLGMVLIGGCRRPYDAPEYAEVDTAETAFLIPLEGNTDDQTKFESEAYLQSLKVPYKRVQITHRWSQTGRWYNEGSWIDKVKLIKVKRSPVTREWTAESATGTSTRNQAIWAESEDSVAFSTGFTVTAFIDEADAARFLYWYPTGSLEQVMDSEVRARVQQAVSEFAARYPLDSLRGKKQEMIAVVRRDVLEFFQKRGVTITTIGMFGGMTYENPEIQKAIDGVFIAQQLKNVNLARFDAQQKENERIELAAKAQAAARVSEAQGEALAVEQINRAIQATEHNPMFLQFKALEVEKARIEKWDGRFPAYMVGGGAGSPMGLMLQLPAAPPATQP